MDIKEQEFLKKKVKELTILLNDKKYNDLVNEGLNLKKKYTGIYLIFNAIGLGYIGLQNYKKAEEVLREGLQKHPDNIFILNNLGMALDKQDKDEEAERYLIQAIKIKNDYLSARVTYANLKIKTNNHREAIDLLLDVYEKNQNNYILNYNLAQAYQTSGDLKNAIKYHNFCNLIEPFKTASDKGISAMTKYKEDNPHLKSMEEKYEQSNKIDEQNKISLNFALGKAYEDLKKFKKSFFHYEKANILKNKYSKFNLELEKKNFKFIKDNLSIKDKKIIKNKDDLIFIVGMPRSGTTLVEQILSSHKKVYGAGELNFMNAIVEDNIFNDDQIKLKDINSEDLEKFSEIYLDKIKSYVTDKQFFVDKALLNFKWIGLLVNMFPNSKIINCQRDPMDTCFSNYKNSFSSYRLDFSYDLRNLGEFYNLYNELMDHWNSLYPENILNFSYENLTENPEAQTKKLINFCNLEWDINCMTFFENKKAVKTASFAQVRNPIYKSSVKSWLNYEEDLKPLLETIKK